MDEILNKFPIEIASYITQYTYNPQNKDLLNDIVNFTELKVELYKLYLDYWTQYNEPDEHINWLSNDIVLYTNNFRHTGVLYGGGYTDMFYDRLFRNSFLKTKENVDKYVINLHHADVNKQIHIYLGLLTTKEREDFIVWHKST